MSKQELQQIGFSDKEANVYLSMLELGLASVQDIAQKAGVNRATTYVMIDSLTKKGLVYTVTRGKKRYFAVEEPKKLTNILEQRKNEIQKQIDTVSKIVPELEALYNIKGEKPIVKFFEGKEGMRMIQDDFYKTKSDSTDELVPLDDAEKIFPLNPGDNRQKALHEKHRDIPRRVIYSSSKGRVRSAKENNLSRRWVPAEKYNFSTEILLYGENKVALSSFKGSLIGVLIESHEIKQTFKAMFDLLWEAAAKYNEEN